MIPDPANSSAGLRENILRAGAREKIDFPEVMKPTRVTISQISRFASLTSRKAIQSRSPRRPAYPDSPGVPTSFGGGPVQHRARAAAAQPGAALATHQIPSLRIATSRCGRSGSVLS